MNWFFDSIARLVGQVVFWATVQPWEQAIRVRLGKHVRRLVPGIHLRIPIIDVVHTQTSAWRATHIPTQTLSTRDGATVVTGGNVGYVIADIEALYRTLHHAEDTISQVSSAAIAEQVQAIDKAELTPELVAKRAGDVVREKLAAFGLADVDLRITDFAFVRVHRLVMDQRWMVGAPLQTQAPQ